MEPSSVSIAVEAEAEVASCVENPGLGLCTVGCAVIGVGAADEVCGATVDDEGGRHDEGLGRRVLEARLLSPNSQ